LASGLSGRLEDPSLGAGPTTDLDEPIRPLRKQGEVAQGASLGPGGSVCRGTIAAIKVWNDQPGVWARLSPSPFPVRCTLPPRLRAGRMPAVPARPRRRKGRHINDSYHVGIAGASDQGSGL